MKYEQLWKEIAISKIALNETELPKYAGVSIKNLTKEELEVLVLSLLEREPYGFDFSEVAE